MGHASSKSCPATSSRSNLEHFEAKWTPVLVKKMREYVNLGNCFVSMKHDGSKRFDSRAGRRGGGNFISAKPTVLGWQELTSACKAVGAVMVTRDRRGARLIQDGGEIVVAFEKSFPKIVQALAAYDIPVGPARRWQIVQRN